MASDVTCATCRFSTDMKPKWEGQPMANWMRQCRKNSPFAGEGGPWPWVSNHDWCGEHTDRKEA